MTANVRIVVDDARERAQGAERGAALPARGRGGAREAAGGDGGMPGAAPAEEAKGGRGGAGR